MTAQALVLQDEWNIDPGAKDVRQGGDGGGLMGRLPSQRSRIPQHHARQPIVFGRKHRDLSRE